MFPVILNDISDEVTAFIAILSFVIGSFILLITGCYLVSFWWEIKDWWNEIFGIYPVYNSNVSSNSGTNTTYTKKPVKPKTYAKNTIDKDGLYPYERHAPPKALFFERKDGTEREAEGPWEEIHLSGPEKISWENKKRRNDPITLRNDTKTSILDESKAFLNENDDFKGYRG